MSGNNINWKKVYEYQGQVYANQSPVHSYWCEWSQKDTKYICEDDTYTENGIVLHFMRIGLFNKKNSTVKCSFKIEERHKKDVSEPSDDSIKKLWDKSIGIEKFYPARTFLSVGYLYVFSSEPDQWLEYEVAESGLLKPIPWRIQTQNERMSVNDVTLLKSVVISEEYLPKDKILWVGFSHEQWSKDYHKTIYNLVQNKEEKQLSSFLTKIKCDYLPASLKKHDRNELGFYSTLLKFEVDWKRNKEAASLCCET